MKTIVKSHLRKGRLVKKHIRIVKSRARWHDIALSPYDSPKKINNDDKQAARIVREDLKPEDYEGHYDDKILDKLGRITLTNYQQFRKSAYNDFKGKNMPFKSEVFIDRKPRIVHLSSANIDKKTMVRKSWGNKQRNGYYKHFYDNSLPRHPKIDIEKEKKWAKRISEPDKFELKLWDKKEEKDD